MENTLTEPITIDLPVSVIETLRRTSQLSGAAVSAIVAESLHHALAPLDDLPPDQAMELAQLSLLDDSSLWRIARSRVSSRQHQELTDLLDRQSVGSLSDDDSDQLSDLLDAYGRHTVKKAHAYLLLARRGYRVPTQHRVA